jgi:hypothetical protein
LCYLLVVYPLLNLGQDYRETVSDLQFKLRHLEQVANGKGGVNPKT